MKQHEAVIKVMEENGGFATLAFLNKNVLKIPDCEWKTKTPFASIRRIVQDKRFFLKIRPGLWALKTYQHKLPDYINLLSVQSKRNTEDYSHSYYQGLIVEIGNFKKKTTFIANQDKNKIFLGKRLTEVATVSHIYKFGYDYIVHLAESVDVIWFNNRKMPDSFFEVEHTTDIINSLKKFAEFQDFYAGFRIVADEHRRSEFDSKLCYSAFSSIKDRVKFLSYEDLAEYHSKASQYEEIEKRIAF